MVDIVIMLHQLTGALVWREGVGAAGRGLSDIRVVEEMAGGTVVPAGAVEAAGWIGQRDVVEIRGVPVGAV